MSHILKQKKVSGEKKVKAIEIQTDIKLKKVKKQSNYTNPDAGARLVGRINTVPIYLEGHLVTGLLDTGSQLSMISRSF